MPQEQSQHEGQAARTTKVSTLAPPLVGPDPAALPDYKLGEILGQGAFGRVYKALKWSTGETVAVKQLSLNNVSKSSLSEILSEINLLKNLNHPNIVQYRGSAESGESLYIILEFVENGSLSFLCKKFGAFPESLVSIYMVQVLEGLIYLHDQGVIHRDIKGSNILATKDGSVKLADFGVATHVSSLTTSNDSDDKKKVKEAEATVVGSPYWMAPELIIGQQVTPACDIWSCGCVVIELLQGGKPPNHQLDAMPALFHIVNDDCLPFPTSISSVVKDFLLQCFEKNANQRISAKSLSQHTWMNHARNRLILSKSPTLTEQRSKLSSPSTTYSSASSSSVELTQTGTISSASAYSLSEPDNFSNTPSTPSQQGTSISNSSDVKIVLPSLPHPSASSSSFSTTTTTTTTSQDVARHSKRLSTPSIPPLPTEPPSSPPRTRKRGHHGHNRGKSLSHLPKATSSSETNSTKPTNVENWDDDFEGSILFVPKKTTTKLRAVSSDAATHAANKKSSNEHKNSKTSRKNKHKSTPNLSNFTGGDDDEDILSQLVIDDDSQISFEERLAKLKNNNRKSGTGLLHPRDLSNGRRHKGQQ